MLRHVFLSSSLCLSWSVLGFWGATPVLAAASSAMMDSCYRLTLDTVAVHETGDLAGFTTYRLYVDMLDPNDRLVSVAGDLVNPLSIETTGTFFQDPAGQVTAEGVNPVLLDFFPTLVYDSYVTIGLDGPADTGSGQEATSTLQTSGQPWTDQFEAGGNILMSDEAGGIWYVLGSATNALAGDDQRVLVAQLTTDGDISATVYAQILDADWQPGMDDLQLPLTLGEGCATPQIQQCAALTPDGVGQDAVMFLFDVNGDPVDDRFFVPTGAGLTLTQSGDGTASISGQLVDITDAAAIFNVDISFDNGVAGSVWPNGYKYATDCIVDASITDNWQIYLMAAGQATLTGEGALAGDTLNLTHAPSTEYFGFQVGEMANDRNCNYGASGWFTYDGTLDGQPLTVGGNGTLNMDLDCSVQYSGQCGIVDGGVASFCDVLDSACAPVLTGAVLSDTLTVVDGPYCEVMVPAPFEGGETCNGMLPHLLRLFDGAGDPIFSYAENGTMITGAGGELIWSQTVALGPDMLDGFDVSATFSPAMTWAEWSNQSFSTGYKKDCAETPDLHEEWEYRILLGGMMEGFGQYAGDALNLTHAPANQYFGSQFGVASNNQNAEMGFSTWATGTGMLNGTEVAALSITISADLTCSDGTQYIYSADGVSGDQASFSFHVGACVTDCGDPEASNYNAAADVVDNSLCQYPGCTDPGYEEYSPSAFPDDGSCATPVFACGTDVEYDGDVYTTVEIGGQCWFGQNLRATHYADGTLIDANLSSADWSVNATGATAVYGEGDAFCYDEPPTTQWCDEFFTENEFGRLYNHHAVTHAGGLCPSGWHVPTSQEWSDLAAFVESDLGGGDPMAVSSALRSQVNWGNTAAFPEEPGDDLYGFQGMPGGARNANGDFEDAGNFGYWWSSDVLGAEAESFSLYSGGWDAGYPRSREWGHAVRCLLGVATGCTDPDYVEYDPVAEEDDGSCLTLQVQQLQVSCADFDPPAGATFSEVGCAGTWSSADSTVVWTLVDNEPPVFGESNQQFVMVECPLILTQTQAEDPTVVPLMVTDNCDGDLAFSIEATLISGGCPFTWHRIWTATDDCGNASVYEQFIQLYDEVAPVVTAPADLTLTMALGCGETVSPSLSGVAAVSDNCSSVSSPGGGYQDLMESNMTYVDVITPDPCATGDPLATYTITRTWTTDDYCLNQGSDVQVITVNPPSGCHSPVLDGYLYEVVEIGEQCWFAENLRTTVYADGTPIPTGLTDSEWDVTTSGATAVYGEGDGGCTDLSPDFNACDDALALDAFGRLYNFNAVMEPAGLCPSGWHVATDEEWMTLEIFLGMSVEDANSEANPRGTDEGNQLKSTSGWYAGNNGTDEVGFGALPGGYRRNGFNSGGSSAQFWSPSLLAYGRQLNSFPTIIRGIFNSANGHSVRCLQDPVPGCTDAAACNYDASAQVDDGSCLPDVNANGVCDDAESGCMDADYVEFDPEAVLDDGSCAYLIDPNCVSPTMDGHTYEVVQIGEQCWFAENLRTELYADGSMIPTGLSNALWQDDNQGASTVYGELTVQENCYAMSPDFDACDPGQSLVAYGRLYNGYAVQNEAGLCPSGWRVPSDGDWMALETRIGIGEEELASVGQRGADIGAGTQLRSASGWVSPPGTDNWGFHGLPGGYRTFSGGFELAGELASWWSSSLLEGAGIRRDVESYFDGISRGGADLRYGFSVRCLRNEDVLGCTDPGFIEYNAEATTDDGSCTAPVDPDCTSPTMDGYTYDVVQIGYDCWFAENLRTRVYADGSTIPEPMAEDATGGISEGVTVTYGDTTGACVSVQELDLCNPDVSGSLYGRLYNGYAISDPRGLCPTGWHVPDHAEWKGLEQYVGVPAGELDSLAYFRGQEAGAGTRLKATEGWYSSALIQGTDSVGFRALPGGRWSSSGGSYGAGFLGYWWSWQDSNTSLSYGRIRNLNAGSSGIQLGSLSRQHGASVRCIRDAALSNVFGCMDSTSCAFDPAATFDDGSCTYGDHVFSLSIATDRYPDETAWQLVDEAGTVVIANDYEYTAYPFDEFSETVCLDAGCYTFTITDAYGDGICCDYGQGLYTLVIDGDTVQGGQFGYTEVLTFCVGPDAGCTVESACNYDPDAYPDSGLCDFNCSPCAADTDGDGVCDVDEVAGCTDPCACNYDADATDDDGLCLAADVIGVCGGDCIADVNGNGVCDALEAGCTDAGFIEFNPVATIDDGSCQYPVNPNCVSPTMDGHTYEVVQIGEQCWFAENLKTTVLANGAPLQQGFDELGWAEAPGPALTYYQEGGLCYQSPVPDFDICDVSALLDNYGYLYNGHAVVDPGGLCPAGWTVPEQVDWSTLESTVMSTVDGAVATALKSTTGWNNDGNGTDAVGFNGRPGGDADPFEFYTVTSAGNYGFWWSSTLNGDLLHYRFLGALETDLMQGNASIQHGYSVRCLLKEDVLGCTDAGFIEYNAEATTDDGSCTFEVDPDCASPTMDGYTYDVVQIGNDCWFAENLRTSVYRDGTPIPGNLDNETWSSATAGAMSVYGDSATVCTEPLYGPDFDVCDAALSLENYGRLYNGYALLYPEGVCPAGWRVPTDSHWQGLEQLAGVPAEELGQYNQVRGDGSGAGTRLKATEGWSETPTFVEGTDELGFRGLPGGNRSSNGSLSSAGTMGGWWTHSPLEEPAGVRRLYSSSAGVELGYQNRLNGYSVRCVMDGSTANVFGCTDSTSCTYDPAATIEDGSCLFGSLEASLTIQLDQYPAETTWTLEDEEGMQLLFGGYTFEMEFEQVVESFCLEPGCYTFTIYDDFGDGMCCQWGDGSYSLAIAGDTIEGGQFGFADSWAFCVGTDYGCQDETACNFDPDASDESGLCDYGCNGCTNDQALNYAPSATIDDGSCLYGGCTDSTASNYDAGAAFDDGSCPLLGCTDPLACNYDAAATDNDGSCQTEDALGICGGTCESDLDGDGVCDDAEVPGCTNPSACNYDASATDDDGSCEMLDALGECGGACESDLDGDGVCDDTDPCLGALDSCGVCNGPGAIFECGCTALPAGYCDCDGNQLDALGICGGTCTADVDGDGICDDAEVPGCTNPFACNYDAAATDDDGSCQTVDALGICGGICTADVDGDGLCDEVDPCLGALDSCGVCNGPGAIFECGCANIPDGDCDCDGNQPDALGICGGTCAADVDGDGVCDDAEVPGCTNPFACNYDAAATDDDGSCEMLDAVGICGGTCESDVDGDGVCDTDELAGCTNPFACNYDASATDDDGSCQTVDALGVCGGTCASDADGDGVCDDVDPCVGAIDSCGVCNGPGAIFECGCANIPEGDCDCDGNQLDALGVCGGTCPSDTDGDGVCDTDEVVGCMDLAACNFDPLATDAGTCFYEDGLGICGGTCPGDADGDGICDTEDTCDGTLDACGVCNGPGAIYACGCADLEPGACDCDGNIPDAIGVCDGECEADVNQNGICDDVEPTLCGEGTTWDPVSGTCVSEGGYGVGETPGCAYAEATNFDIDATVDDGSCVFPVVNPCPTDINGDGTTGTQDLLLLLGSYSLICGE